jgi:ribosome-associated heat shock protein Hsp15
MDGLRIDKWLWFARFCKSRSLAQHLIEGGEVTLNGRPVARAGMAVKPGDELVIPIGRGWRRICVRALATRRGPAPEARLMYEELSAAGLGDNGNLGEPSETV